jgi:hypothetical protein
VARSRRPLARSSRHQRRPCRACRGLATTAYGKTEHHAILGSYFLTHPPICKIRVDVTGDQSLTRGLGASFVVEDEPYFIELQDPKSTRIF